MGKITGFKEYPRAIPADRPTDVRVKDWKDVHGHFTDETVKVQAARCMDCGIPFCHKGCPLGNIIPDWNDLVYRDHWKEALQSLLSTNNFPEFTGRICPAPCEDSCVLNIQKNPVTIERIEQEIIEQGFKRGYMTVRPPQRRTGKKVAVIGSGPSGLAAADQLNKAGHSVTVFERSDRIGGLLMYGIPDFKLEKWVVQRRVDLMKEEGVQFKVSSHVGVNIKVEDLRKDFDVIVLAGGATKARDLNIQGRDLKGVHFAVDFLTQQNKRNQGETISKDIEMTANDKSVVVLGGGDTGSDCHGTSLRQGAKKVTSFELLPKPPETRAPSNPWPDWGRVFRTSSSHEEGGSRDWSILTKSFSGENGVLKKINMVRLKWVDSTNGGPPKMEEIPGSEHSINADLVLLALGFLGPETNTMIQQLGVALTDRGNIQVDKNYMTTVPGIFAAGDMRRGQSLVVWAIWEGREAARCVDAFLMKESALPTSPFHY